MRQKLPAELQEKITPQIWQIFKKFTDNGFEIYLIGGGVRNILMGEKPPIDVDFTTNATPAEIRLLFPHSFYNNVFGTVGIPIKKGRKKGKIEITTYRKEAKYSDFRRPDKVEWGKNLEEDLKRRDFTFNAVAIGPILKKGKWDGKTLEIVDLFGGINDLKNKIIRAVGNPHKRFSEDALRMLRAIRFAAELGFIIEEKTFQAIKENANLIEKISQERIRDELLKIFASPYPADGYQLLRNSTLAQIILPEVEKMFGVPQKSPKRHHQDDVGTHALKSLKYSRSRDPIVNLAILLHDVGKPIVFKRDKEGVITFYNHEVIGASIALNIARRLCLSKKERERLFKLVRWHQFSVDENQTDKAIRRFIRNVGKENLKDILELRRADRLGGGARETSWRLEKFKKRLEEVQKQPFTVADLKVDGYDVMRILNISPGPLVGKILNLLFTEVEEDKEKNNREYLIKRIKELGKELI
ncbi:MAG: CCA tRNA nucleotidyltransferase [Microgenomates group bacterium]